MQRLQVLNFLLSMMLFSTDSFSQCGASSDDFEDSQIERMKSHRVKSVERYYINPDSTRRLISHSEFDRKGNPSKTFYPEIENMKNYTCNYLIRDTISYRYDSLTGNTTMTEIENIKMSYSYVFSDTGKTIYQNYTKRKITETEKNASGQIIRNCYDGNYGIHKSNSYYAYDSLGRISTYLKGVEGDTAKTYGWTKYVFQYDSLGRIRQINEQTRSPYIFDFSRNYYYTNDICTIKFYTKEKGVTGIIKRNKNSDVSVLIYITNDQVSDSTNFYFNEFELKTEEKCFNSSGKLEGQQEYIYEYYRFGGLINRKRENRKKESFNMSSPLL